MVVLHLQEPYINHHYIQKNVNKVLKNVEKKISEFRDNGTKTIVIVNIDSILNSRGITSDQLKKKAVENITGIYGIKIDLEKDVIILECSKKYIQFFNETDNIRISQSIKKKLVKAGTRKGGTLYTITKKQMVNELTDITIKKVLLPLLKDKKNITLATCWDEQCGREVATELLKAGKAVSMPRSLNIKMVGKA